MDMFILLTVLQMLSLNEAYNFTCPSQAHWNIRAKSMCEPSRNYTCLFNVTFRVNVYRDRCNRPRILGSGYKYVFQPNLNRATCSVTRYQPFIFDTIGHSDCTYQKSLCNSLGQETYENGNTAVDRKCICNTDRGYSFVKNLQNQCYCNPSTEDCSCYLGINPYNETVVLKDMKCYDDMKMTRRRYLGDRFNISRKIKIVEFDNYRYNVNNVPTTEYRIKAAKFVMIISFAYFVVWIIVMRIMRQWIGSRIIPRKCDMVESTDCSITIEWFIDVQDKCLSYELYRRPQRTDDVTLRKFSSYDVFEGENGRRMYKLQNLLPETYYEFKLRSVYNDVKSHYSESMTKQTLKLAPRKLDIVECTDCSITIHWFIDVPDKCLSYEVDYRPQGMNDWSTETFLSEDLLKDEDGRRMYTLQNLPPDTYYEFKMRSVYKVAKSHYSESMIMQTLKLVLPEAINHLSEGDKTRYNKLMQTSKTENRYFVRIMIVGKKSAGKTCLLRRLLKESISDVTSTDGVDIVVRRCKINIRDGKWTIGKEIDDDKVGRIKRALTPNAEDRDTQHMQVDETTNINTRHDEMSTNNRYITTDAKVSQDKSEDKNESLSLLMPEDFTTDVMDNLDKNEVTNESSLVMPEDFTSDAKDNLDNNDKKKESSSLVMPEDLMSHVFSRSTVNTPSNLHALCELWDFAGQEEFYATHQAFLTSSAVYLVVADMEDDISKQGFSQCFADFQHVGEYVDFWFDSIHCHRTADERTSYEHFDPPIILVFTGKDKYDKAEFKKREKELDAQMDKVLGFQSKYHHLHDKLYLSNTKDSDEEFEKLQFAIYETVRKMDNWGNAFPLKWILLEHLIEINKNNGRNFINLNDMFNLAKHPNINILEKEDVLLFLRFQHNVGNIIFFENIPDLIILKPQWLADAFRCLVSDKFDYRRLHHLEDWTLFTRQGKISELLITELFNSKDGSQFSGQTINLHKVMEKLDILVKIENSHYIMPSMMPSAKFEDICETFCIVTEKCKRTSWLCFKFEFLPPSFFNHLSAWFIRQYHPSKIDGGIALYRGICMFDIDASGCVKILVTMSTDTIALQVVSFSEQQRELYSECSNIYSGVIQLIEDVKERYKVKISFKLHFKCSDGDYYKDTFEYDTLTKNQECFCPHHQRHRSEQIYSPWMKTEVKKIPGTAKISTKQDNHYARSYKPKNVPCPPEKNEPNKKEAFALDQASVNQNLPVSVTLRQQIKLKKSVIETLTITSCIKIGNTLVFTDLWNDQLFICNSDGTDVHHIHLPYRPYYITEVDSNTVAISCTLYSTILIINISTGSITRSINTSGECDGISDDDNNLYVVINRSIIHVMSPTGKVISTIPLPSNSFNDITVHRDRLFCIDTKSIYCCSLDGKQIWEFKNDKYKALNHMTTDDGGNVYVTDWATKTVLVVSEDGKNYREILTCSDGLNTPCGIYFDKKENILLVCNSDGKAFLFDVNNK